MPRETPIEYAGTVVSDLEGVLHDLYENQYPTLESPAGLKKRASVALIIRVRPHYLRWPQPRDTTSRPHSKNASTRISDFFAQDWVKAGDPEVLFIKRASREGDRWTGHVALPGGRRDPEDADDVAAAIRETEEEVGIDLTEENSITIGNLPQRLVTTQWGKVPLMVLCPYVFLLTANEIPPLRLQPTEIASTHWVPIRALLSPSARTYEYQDLSNRLAKQEFGIKRWLLRGMLGKMLFSAIRLVPSESSYCSSAPDFVPPNRPKASGLITLASNYAGYIAPPALGTDRPLILWGLTLGVMADFLELLPPYNALQLWTYPTFSSPDVRFIVWLLSFRFRRQKQRELAANPIQSPPAIELGLDQMPSPRRVPQGQDRNPSEGGISGLGTYSSGALRRRYGSTSGAVGTMLEGYYELLRKGVVLAVVGRTAALIAFAATVTYQWRKRRAQRL